MLTENLFKFSQKLNFLLFKLKRVIVSSSYICVYMFVHHEMAYVNRIIYWKVSATVPGIKQVFNCLSPFLLSFQPDLDTGNVLSGSYIPACKTLPPFKSETQINKYPIWTNSFQINKLHLYDQQQKKPSCSFF